MLAWSMLIGYFAARYLLFERLDTYFQYASYIFEFAFVGLAAYLYRGKFRFELRPDRRFWAASALCAIVGFGISVATVKAGVGIPFAMDQGVTIFFLLTLSPVLEELLFRMALLLPLAQLLAKRNASVTIAANAALFAAVHWVAVFQVNSSVAPFVAVQSVYTLALGGLCASWMMRTTSVAYPMGLHFFFNVGFYLGAAACGLA
ncbi:MAG TPA: CPBP family glutamic-type intramembrane protease [Bdellovibrionota bacterium]|jgi:membrane protease YdiL (CAAX protease family)|nr:CPBP family glutamic-type intramembrane protease [Bdellovibrionota bacterium]